MKMSRKRLDISWSRVEPEDIKPALKRYTNHLKSRGLRESTIELYVRCTKSYLEFVQTDKPSLEDSLRFRESLLERNLSRSSINNYTFAILNYHKMLGDPIDLPLMKRNDEIPYFFDEFDVLSILGASAGNIKHFTMLQTIFFCCLRASEMCNLDDEDVDLRSLTLRIRQGKGGVDGLVPISNECATTLRRYLQVRPSLEVDGKRPLFFTDFGRRWDRKDVHRMFIRYKRHAGIEKRGGLHVFGRHSPASIMIKNGCDILTVKELLRHRDITTTARYLHVANETLRLKHDRFLRL